MARPGQIDHVTAGLEDLPEKLRAARVSQYLTVYLQQFNFLEEAVQQVIEAFLTWETLGRQFDFVLDALGALLDQPRPEGFDNQDYTFVLQARVKARKSSATQADVYAVANFLSQGSTVYAFRVVPKVVIVVFVGLTLDSQWQDIYEQILLDSVDAVDQLVIDYVPIETAFYDVGEYDSELYAP
jgi:hypothetical protein